MRPLAVGGTEALRCGALQLRPRPGSSALRPPSAVSIGCSPEGPRSHWPKTLKAGPAREWGEGRLPPAKTPQKGGRMARSSRAADPQGSTRLQAHSRPPSARPPPRRSFPGGGARLGSRRRSRHAPAAPTLGRAPGPAQRRGASQRPRPRPRPAEAERDDVIKRGDGLSAPF